MKYFLRINKNVYALHKMKNAEAFVAIESPGNLHLGLMFRLQIMVKFNHLDLSYIMTSCGAHTGAGHTDDLNPDVLPGVHTPQKQH